MCLTAHEGSIACAWGRDSRHVSACLRAMGPTVTVSAPDMAVEERESYVSIGLRDGVHWLVRLSSQSKLCKGTG